MSQFFPQAIVITPKNGKFTPDQMRLLSQSECNLFENVCVLPDDVYRQLAANHLSGLDDEKRKCKNVVDVWNLIEKTEPAKFVTKLTESFDKIEKNEYTSNELSENAKFLLLSVLLDRKKQFPNGFLEKMIFFTASAIKYDMAEDKGASILVSTLKSLKIIFQSINTITWTYKPSINFIRNVTSKLVDQNFNVKSDEIFERINSCLDLYEASIFSGQDQYFHLQSIQEYLEKIDELFFNFGKCEINQAYNFIEILKILDLSNENHFHTSKIKLAIAHLRSKLSVLQKIFDSFKFIDPFDRKYDRIVDWNTLLKEKPEFFITELLFKSENIDGLNLYEICDLIENLLLSLLLEKKKNIPDDVFETVLEFCMEVCNPNKDDLTKPRTIMERLKSDFAYTPSIGYIKETWFEKQNFTECESIEEYFTKAHEQFEKLFCCVGRTQQYICLNKFKIFVKQILKISNIQGILLWKSVRKCVGLINVLLIWNRANKSLLYTPKVLMIFKNLEEVYLGIKDYFDEYYEKEKEDKENSDDKDESGWTRMLTVTPSCFIRVINYYLSDRAKPEYFPMIEDHVQLLLLNLLLERQKSISKNVLKDIFSLYMLATELKLDKTVWLAFYSKFDKIKSMDWSYKPTISEINENVQELHRKDVGFDEIEPNILLFKIISNIQSYKEEGKYRYLQIIKASLDRYQLHWDVEYIVNKERVVKLFQLFNMVEILQVLHMANKDSFYTDKIMEILDNFEACIICVENMTIL